MSTTAKKSLEGIKVTDGLLTLWNECYVDANQDNNEEACTVLLSSINPTTSKRPDCMPLDVLFAIQTILNGDDSRLEKALEESSTSLVFTPPPTKTPEEIAKQQKFQERLARLRLQQEETKYSKLTNNLAQAPQDDITAKSMTYAASVGLNMIVAPISFGVFMYFFAGGIFDYWFSEDFSARTTGGTDIKRVIVGVVSGVLMLFIEMILFVIRTHEFEEANRKKSKKKKKHQPFGVYSKETKTGVTYPAEPSPFQKTLPANKDKSKKTD